uniref:UDP-glucose:glycoprotein glucosyltransferase thioredoxin-like domain-containing protein n=1 Tax=Parascaris equorum TaxID=6256 RepID=A0A914RZ37_PAREQ
MPRINKRVLDAPSYWDALYLDLTDTGPCQMKSSSQLYQLSDAEYNQCIMRRISISMLMNAAARLLPPTQAKQFITKLVKEEIASKLIDRSIKVEDIAVNGMDVEFFRKELKQLTADEIVADAKFAEKALNLQPAERAVVANGLLVGPLLEEEIFEESDVQLLEKLMLSRNAEVWYKKVIWSCFDMLLIN